jgi:glycosyltransferase involved in cell wall biosynthesis
VAARGLDDHVTLLGVRRDVGSVLAACDVAVLASLEEGTPLALIEYGLAGRAVVATDVGEVAEVLDDGRAGRVVPPGDAAAIATAVGGLLADDGARADLGARLARRVEERYSVERLLERWEDVYRRARIRNG